MFEVLTQARSQVPDSNHEKGNYDGSTCVVKKPPEIRSKQRDKEGRKKKRDGSEDGALALHVFATVSFENFVDYSVPAGLHRQIPGAARMRVVRLQYRVASVCLRR